MKLPFLKALKIKRLSISNFIWFHLIYAINSFALVKYVSEKNCNNKRNAATLHEKSKTLNCYVT